MVTMNLWSWLVLIGFRVKTSGPTLFPDNHWYTWPHIESNARVDMNPGGSNDRQCSVSGGRQEKRFRTAQRLSTSQPDKKGTHGLHDSVSGPQHQKPPCQCVSIIQKRQIYPFFCRKKRRDPNNRIAVLQLAVSSPCK